MQKRNRNNLIAFINIGIILIPLSLLFFGTLIQQELDDPINDVMVVSPTGYYYTSSYGYLDIDKIDFDFDGTNTSFTIYFEDNVDLSKDFFFMILNRTYAFEPDESSYNPDSLSSFLQISNFEGSIIGVHWVGIMPEIFTPTVSLNTISFSIAFNFTSKDDYTAMSLSAFTFENTSIYYVWDLAPNSVLTDGGGTGTGGTGTGTGTGDPIVIDWFIVILIIVIVGVCVAIVIIVFVLRRKKTGSRKLSKIQCMITS